ncbi:MAG: hypothetical protein JST26_18805 [Bacteroidetes bacterium]|nr:hypothetical protein [Bacteroidota bacterium]
MTYPSLLVIIAIALFVTGVQNNLGRWRSQNIIKWDVVCYYSYLPATFIKHDVGMSFIKDENSPGYYSYQPIKTPDGKWVIKTSMGMAILYAPFFFVANALAGPMGYEANGYSEIYHFWILVSGLVYLLIGLWYLRKSLLMFYSERVTALTLVVIYFATNLLCYSTREAAMSHEYDVALFSIFIYASLRWHNRVHWKYSFVIGLVLGLLTLIRPVNLLFVLFPLLYGVDSRKALVSRIGLLAKQWKQLLLIACITIAIWIPQFLYWKMITGHYLFNSYINERFYFAHPHILESMLGFRKGWLIYTPVMLFALLGMRALYKQQRAIFPAVVTILVVYILVISSWWCWWYGGSFGQRAMIDLYPMLAFPLAAFLSSNVFQRNLRAGLLKGLIAVFIALNMFQTIQFHYNIIHYDSMTMRAYFNAFGKTSKADCDRSLLKAPDYEKAVRGEEE